MNLAAHPRLLVTDKRRAYLARHQTLNTPEWQFLVRETDFILAHPEQTWVSSNSWMPALALMYLATGDTRYADKAVSILLEIVRDPYSISTNPNTGERDVWVTDDQYWWRKMGPHMALVFDWCHDQILANERAEVAKYLIDRVEYLWFRPGAGDAWGMGTPCNNYLAGFLQSILVVLACYEHDDRAAHAYEWIRQTQIVDLYLPFYAGAGKGGRHYESENYNATYRVGQVFTAILTATGEDFFAQTAFFHDAIVWGCHAILPDMTHYAPLGDQPSTADAPVEDDKLQSMLVCVDNLPDDPNVKYGHYFVRNVGRRGLTTDITGIHYMLYLDPDQVGEDWRGKLPLTYICEGNGTVISRTDWTDEAVVYMFNPVIQDQGHEEQAANGMLVWAGGRLINSKVGYDSHGGESRLTDENDGYILGGTEQRTLSIANSLEDRITVFEPDAFAMEAQVRATYNFTHGPVCEDLTRRTEIHGRLCARYDRVKTVTPMSRKRVVLVSQQEPVIPETASLPGAGNGNVVDYGADLSTWKGRATLVLPTDAVITKEPVFGGIDQALSCWKVFAESGAEGWCVLYQLCPKSEEFPALNLMVMLNGAIWTDIAKIAPPGPTVPNPLPPIKSDGGNPAPIVVPPTPRQGGSMKANFATTDADHVGVLISGLPTGVTIKSAHAQGIEDGRWTYSFPSPPDAPIVVDGMRLTWEKNAGGQTNPNSNYDVTVVGSDNQSETVRVGASVPSPTPTPTPQPTGSQITVTLSATAATKAEAEAIIRAAVG